MRMQEMMFTSHLMGMLIIVLRPAGIWICIYSRYPAWGFCKDATGMAASIMPVPAITDLRLSISLTMAQNTIPISPAVIWCARYRKCRGAMWETGIPARAVCILESSCMVSVLQTGEERFVQEKGETVMREIAMNLSLFGILIAASVWDIKWKQIPLWYLLAAVGAGMSLWLWLRPVALPMLAAGAACGGVLLLAGWYSGGKLGMADGLLFVAAGCHLGIWQNLNLMIWSFLIAAVTALVIWIRKKDKTLQFAFIPCICAAQGMRVFLLATGTSAG